MKAIGDILQNHPVPGIRLSEVRRTCAAAASGLAKWQIRANQVKYESGVLFFSVPSVVKTELLMREADLRALLRAAGIELTAIK